jgi:PST family polysaccharide transporter
MTRRTLNGLFWTFSGTGMQAVLRVLVMIVLARLLTPVDFGLVGVALVVVEFCEIVSQIGIGPAIVQRSNLESRHIRTGFTISVMLGFLLAFLFVGLAPVISQFFHTERLTPVLRAMAPVFVLRAFAIVAESLLQRGLHFRSLAGIQVASYIIGYGIVGVVLAWSGLGFWALVIALLVQTLVNTVALVIIQRRIIAFSLDAGAVRELLYFGTGSTATKIANFVARQSDNVIVGRWLGAAALGIYGRAYQLLAMPANLFGNAVDSVLFPALSQVQSEPQRLASAYRKSIAITALTVLPASAIMFFLAPEIIEVLLGSGWLAVTEPFQVLALGMFFRTAYKIGFTLARASGAVYQMAWRQGLYAFLVLAGSWIGQSHGITGVACAVLFALTIHYLLSAQLGIGIARISWKDFAKAHVPAVALTAMSLTVTWQVVTLARAHHFPDLIILITTVVTVLACAVILVRLMPTLFMGEEGAWLAQTLSRYLGSAFSLMRPRLAHVHDDANR